MSVSTPKSGTSTKSHPMGGSLSPKKLVDKRVPLFSAPVDVSIFEHRERCIVVLDHRDLNPVELDVVAVPVVRVFRKDDFALMLPRVHDEWTIPHDRFRFVRPFRVSFQRFFGAAGRESGRRSAHGKTASVISD